MAPPTSGTTPAAIPPVSPSSHAVRRPDANNAGVVRARSVQNAANNKTLFGAVAVQPPPGTAPPVTSKPDAGPKFKSADGPLHRTLIGVPASEIIASASSSKSSPSNRAGAIGANGANGSQASRRGEVTNAPVLPIGTVESEFLDERRGKQRSTRPQIHSSASREARERDEPKTMPAVPIEAHETPRNAREAVIRDSTTHDAPRVQGGMFSGRPSLPSLPPLRNSLPGRALSKVGNNTLFAVLAAAAVIVVGAEVLRRYPSGESTEEELEAAVAAGDPSIMAASGNGQAATPTGPTTRISTNPSGAEIVYRGAVIANTPAEVARPDSEADYLLRKPGYQPQLVRLSLASPAAITLNLQTSGAASEDGPMGAAALPGAVEDSALAAPIADGKSEQDSPADEGAAQVEAAGDRAGTEATKPGPTLGRSGLPILPPPRKAPSVATK